MSGLSTMQALPELIPAKKLKVFVVEEDKRGHKPLYLAILDLLHDAGIAGATVFKAVEGFGERRVIHSNKTEISSLNMPVTIEATDTPEKIDTIIPQIVGLMTSGLSESPKEI
jgi:uncharacterized protein